MQNKRLIGVITVRDGWAVQSFGYSRYLPLGRPEILAENLDRWGVDEILLLCLDRSPRELGPDFELLRRVGDCGLTTPIVYAGGVRTAQDAQRAVQIGADRVCVDAILHDDPSAVEEMSCLVGAQAVIAAVPLSISTLGLEWFDYRSGNSYSMALNVPKCLSNGVISEVLIIDWRHEGQPDAFDECLLEQWPFKDVPILAFGGISSASQVQRILERKGVAAVAMGNFLSYREHAVQNIKSLLHVNNMRQPQFLHEGNFDVS